MMNSNKLALGTAQFGLKYGIANESGQVSVVQVQEILKCASAKNIQVLDTAIAYGDSEHVLGEVGVDEFLVVTKLPANILGNIEEQIEESLQRLKSKKVYGLLLHQPLELLEEKGILIFEAMQKAKQDGLVGKIGVSVYEPSDLDKLCNQYKFDLIQVPFNIIDNRWDDWLSELKSCEIEVHVRSVFLQGLLLMSAKDRPIKFNKWASIWGKWDDWLKAEALTPLEACLRYALSKPEIDKVIIGVDSKEQLQQIIEAANGDLPEFPLDIKTNDMQLLNPSNWNSL